MKILKSNILALSVVAAGALTLGSCSDSFLDVSSKTESTTGNFYKTEGDAWRALIGCYDGWRRISSNPGVGFYVASTVMSDEAYGGTGAGDGFTYQSIDHFDISFSPSDMNMYETDWVNYYAAVYRCNELLDRADDIAWLENTGNRELYLGEAHALRALCYFDMVRLWGNIPLFLEAINENREQANPDDVYAAIFADFKFAAENIPADANLTKADNGRITKYAAEAMAARAYLFYTGYYGKEPEGITKAEVLNYLNDIVASHNFELVTAVKDLFPASSLVPLADSSGWNPELSTYAGEANSEVILQQKFTPSQDYNGNADSNRWQVMMGMRSINSSPYGKGWGAATTCPAFVEMFPANDPRREAAIIDLAAEGVTSVADFENGWKDWREYTGYTCKKYSPIAFPNGNSASKPDGTGDFQITNMTNWVIMRYADVLLMIAELGDVPAITAQQALDEVRARSGLASIPATKANVLNERALELAYEGHRYWDLLRQGVDVLAAAIVAKKGPVTSGGAASTVEYDAEKIRQTKGLSQIPYNQITLANGTLKQNAGW
ncbi:MAG: RagB/SusD family nutrient uptake outer membrane protein [Duncaniella sp.]|nr:RagB/SusD family nutrient uptake outer membrane protein [Duncaniella sp.]